MSEEFSLQRGAKRTWSQADGEVSSSDSDWDLAPEQTATGVDLDSDSGAPEETSQAAMNPVQPPWLSENPGDDAEESDGALGAEIMMLARGCWRLRYVIAGITLSLSSLFVVASITGFEHSWTATTVLIKQDNSDQFAIGEGKAFKPQSYSLQTLLDTLKLPSSLDEVIRLSEIDVNRTSFAAVIDFNLGQNSDILRLSTTWKDPATAALIANNLAQVYLQKSVDIQRQYAEDSFTYYNERLELSHQKVVETDAAMLEFQQKHQLSDFDAETKARLGALANLEADYETQKNQVAALQYSIIRVQADIDQQPDMVIKSTIYRSPLKQRLTDYEWELREANSRYTADNPKVLKLQKKINVLDNMIGDNNDESVPENAYAPNAHREDLQLHLQELLHQVKIAEANTRGLENTINGMLEKLAFLNVVAKEYVRLKSSHDSAKDLETSLMVRVEEARLQMLRTEPAFAILEPATAPEQPNPSGRKLLVAGGSVLALAAGFATALLMQLLDPLVRSRHHGFKLTGVDLCMEWAEQEDDAKTPLEMAAPGTASASLFRQLINDLESSYSAEELQSLAFVSASPTPSRSQVAAMLGLTLAIKETPTLLVNADFTAANGDTLAPGVGAIATEPGLIDILEQRADLSAVVQATGHDNLHYLGTGPIADPQRSLLALGSKAMSQLIDTLTKAPEPVMYDLPSLSGQETALEAAAAVGSVILVMQSGVCHRKQVAQLVTKLKQRHVKVIAAIVAQVPHNYLEEPAADRGNKRWRDNLHRGWNNVTGSKNV